MGQRFVAVQRAIEAAASGQLMIIVDSEDRENEGDFFIPAGKITPEVVYFMLSRGCGQLCMPVAREMADRLEFEPLVRNNQNPNGTAFAVPVDHRGCKTGVSPEERVLTMQAIVDPCSRPDDFVRPGHVFPLIAREGGVLRRPGHTESAVDLARLAGLAHAGVLCEVCSQDRRHMADRQELLEIAGQYQLPVLAIEDLIRFRLLHDKASRGPPNGQYTHGLVSPRP
jgi:3,4-dihydroxy 2-butanone 4-phosphate synthase/GTP cyclohydrolase II